MFLFFFFFFFQAEDGIRDGRVTGVQTCALPIYFVLIEFGHNDEKTDDSARYTDPKTTYPQYLSKRSEERRVGKECRSRWSPDHEKKKEKKTREHRYKQRGAER